MKNNAYNEVEHIEMDELDQVRKQNLKRRINVLLGVCGVLLLVAALLIYLIIKVYYSTMPL